MNAPGNFGFLFKLVSKTIVLPFGLLDNKRSIISLNNVSNFLSLVSNHPKAANETFLLSENDGVSTKEITNQLASCLGRKLIQLPIPVLLFRLLGELFGKEKMIESLVGDIQVNSSKAKNVLGWKPIENMRQSMLQIKTWKK